MIPKRRDMKKATMPNGYNPSILNTHEGRCYLCGRYGETARHELYYGNYRKTSKLYGLWVNLGPACHNTIHMHGDIARSLRKVAQEAAMDKHGWTVNDFRDFFGRSDLL